MKTRAAVTRGLPAIGLILTLGWAASASGAVEPEITSPSSHTSVPAQVDPTIQFKGTYPYTAKARISVQAVDPTGGWSTVGGARVRSTGEWTATVKVPSLFYLQPCGIGVFRVTPNDGKPPLPVWDQACLDSAPPDTTVCRRDIVVLSQTGRSPTTFTGNVSVLGAKQAEKFACIQDVQGSLDVSDSSPPHLATWLTREQAEAQAKVSMPNLRYVSNDLKVTIGRFLVLPVSTVGGGYATGELDLPGLSQVGGSINLRAVDPVNAGSSGHKYKFGLDALTSVGGGVTIDNEVAHNHYVALGALTEIPGDLNLLWTKSSDLLETALLQALQTVHGNVTVMPHSNIQTVFPNLAVVNGDVRIHATGSSGPPYSMVKKLGHVGGNLSVRGGFKWGCSEPTFPDLLTVDGQLILIGGAPRGTIGAAGLSLGGLQIDATEVTMLPLPTGLQVANTGVVSIGGNTKLCQCQVDSFISALQSAGWTGTPPTPNNGSAAMCGPCPVPTCQ